MKKNNWIWIIVIIVGVFFFLKYINKPISTDCCISIMEKYKCPQGAVCSPLSYEVVGRDYCNCKGGQVIESEPIAICNIGGNNVMDYYETNCEGFIKNYCCGYFDEANSEMRYYWGSDAKCGVPEGMSCTGSCPTLRDKSYCK